MDKLLFSNVVLASLLYYMEALMEVKDPFRGSGRRPLFSTVAVMVAESHFV
ncbi:hypothetical protein BDA96_10G038500 [Sorghum bicolor]|uniref:Uncharacterized protein n=1 Tax=Sorghum bicolor TaxID=4558 RepID=A0A921TZM9_SORBI|nr:hypothetical protein BDA96_10G038500 [Sorghum bicolor]